ncbi:asparagine synthase (glutamine-hydrolyzing) [Amycolatopsis regifaucium]|uniref:asparagine synthase (glutamine-hydrolyzing) n=1 Tax=Amycolatopsis regifaucium TaxID=546365 RepID=A0A154M516_9PSEU|nr:asparagine synthase (glutamine-hydrolyzing) [Amycolatopsis regifaucium]KZB79656.1 asparagine synthetase B [Amycolatopsis regifaucium]OKA10029.1 asparagine synthase (glutamine-hydrolyzing) [Amycolatopsis regifaucium]SFI64449.1 asparagine synthase (glutamine-hydrolysing) [Amycolatopsis regifaucium]
MCGIAGWVDFGRDLTRERDTVQAMTDTMTKRGPDAGGIWLSPHAALGHRRLSIIDLDGGRQPMAAGPAVLTYSGEVYNFRELRAELTGRGHRFGTRSDTEVVLRAFLEWGEAFVDRLNGMYAFAIWDGDELLLVRDRMGVKPLFYFPTADGVLFGSEPKAILANPLAERVLDTDGLRDLLSVAKNPGHAVFRGMRELPPGNTLRVRRDGIELREYWSLQAREHPDDLATTIGTVRELLEDTVARQLVADVPLCTLLSGGLDSSTLTALAARTSDVRSYSVKVTDQPGDNLDHVHARLVADHVGARYEEILHTTVDLLAPSVKAAVLTAYDLPIAKGDEHASLHELFRLVRERSTVALSGECGDEVFGGYRWYRKPDAVWSGTFPWVHSGRSRHEGLELLFAPDLMTKLGLREYERDSHDSALAELSTVSGEDPLEARMREVTYLGLTRHAQVLFDRKDRMSMAAGLEVRVPFTDHRLVEYTFNVPWSMKNFDGREKSLLRAVGKDLLPAEVLSRAKTPYPSIEDDSYDRILRDRLRSLILAKDEPLSPLLTGEFPEGRLTRPALETTLQLNDWLKAYDVRLVL